MNTTTTKFRLLFIGVVSGLIYASQVAMGGSLTIPKTWGSSETLTASDLNGNFQSVKTEIDDNNDRITSLEAKHTSGIFSVSAVVSIPRDTSCITKQFTDNTTYIGRYAASNCLAAPEYLVAPVTLPNGATITAFRYTAYDNDASKDSNGILFRSDGAQLATVSAAGCCGALVTDSTTVVTNPIVDNSTYAYFVYMAIYQASGTNLVPVNAVIEYTFP